LGALDKLSLKKKKQKKKRRRRRRRNSTFFWLDLYSQKREIENKKG
jgi:hypothetical protein